MPLPDADTFATLGGPLNEYSVVRDPTTDLPGVADNATRGDVAGVTRMIMRALCVFVYNGASVALLSDTEQVWGNEPSDQPVVARTGPGVFTLTYPTTVSNVVGDTVSVNLRRGWGQVENSLGMGVQVERTSANVMTVRVFDTDTKAAVDPTNKTVDVWIR